MEQILAGRSQHQIASSLGISQPAVSKMLRRVEDRLLEDVAYQVERQRARQTLQLEYIMAAAMRAWHASQQERLRRRQRRTDTEDGGTSIAEVVSENRHGDPRYLDEARKALADLRTLWGLAEPDRLAVTAYSAMSDAALDAELARQARLLQIDADPDTVPPRRDVDPDVAGTGSGVDQ